jgi:hypothetical protein
MASTRTILDELKDAAETIARHERLLEIQLQARGHQGEARIYRDSDGRWNVRLKTKGTEPFSHGLGYGTKDYEYVFNHDLPAAFREALKAAHTVENAADYSAWFEDEATQARRAAERQERIREKLLGDTDIIAEYVREKEGV